MAIGPVVLISGVGLLILSLTNRLGRVIDRGRLMAGELRKNPDCNHKVINEQLCILSHRARLLQRSIICAVLCLLFAAILIIAIFIIGAMKIEAAWLIAGLFVCAMGSLIVSLVTFLQELNRSLFAFRLDIGK
jgi:hypothetical protein